MALLTSALNGTCRKLLGDSCRTLKRVCSSLVFLFVFLSGSATVKGPQFLGSRDPRIVFSGEDEVDMLGSSDLYVYAYIYIYIYIRVFNFGLLFVCLFVQKCFHCLPHGLPHYGPILKPKNHVPLPVRHAFLHSRTSVAFNTRVLMLRGTSTPFWHATTRPI